MKVKIYYLIYRHLKLNSSFLQCKKFAYVSESCIVEEKNYFMNDFKDSSILKSLYV